MALREPKSILQRKLARAREGRQAGDRSALRALRQALGRSSRDVVDLPLSVIGATQSRVMQDDVVGAMEADRLLILLDGPEGLSGAATLDLPLVSALIQQQTTGRISATVPSPRTFTETDAALAAPLLEDLLKRAAELTRIPADRACLEGYRYGACAEDAPSLALTLEADKFRVFELTIDIAAGQRQGAIGLILPEREAPAPASETAVQGADAGPRLGDAVMAARAELRAILCRVQMPLADLAAMQQGDLLPLPSQHLDKTELQTISGEILVAGRLGQAEGFRAIRLNETELPRDTGAGIFPAYDGDADGGAGEHTDASLAAFQMAEQGPVSGEDIGLDTGMDFGADAGGMETLPALLDGDALIDTMTPDQVAADISQLAGLADDDESEAHSQALA